MNEMLHHNQPDMAQTASETMADINEFLKENPVIQDEEHARSAKLFIYRGKLAIADLEDERTEKTRPLNEQIKAINNHYRTPRENLQRIIDEISQRVSAFLLIEEHRRIKEAEEARRKAETLELLAREAERIEQSKMADAAAGELGVDVVAAVENADKTFDEYKKAQRQAALAEKETHVRLGGGFTRALSLRGVETLEVTDLMAAVKAMETSDRIVEAVLKAARSYKKVFGEYPPGIKVTVERKA